MKSDPTQRRRRRLAGLSIAAFIALMLAIFLAAGRPMAEFFRDPAAFRTWAQEHGIGGRLVFIGLMTMQIVVAFIPGEPLEICAGVAFGWIEGTLLCLSGAALGSMLVFVFVRRIGAPAVEVFFSREKIDRLRWMRDARFATMWMSVLFLFPGTPKDLLSYLAGLTRIRFGHWMLIATLARIPSVVTSTIGGSALGEQSYLLAGCVFAATLVLAGIGLVVYRKVCARHDET